MFSLDGYFGILYGHFNRTVKKVKVKTDVNAPPTIVMLNS